MTASLEIAVLPKYWKNELPLPYAGINRIRFRGFVLRPNGHP